MQISRISQSNPSFGYKMTQRYVNQITKTQMKNFGKEKGTKLAKLTLSIIKETGNDNTILDYKNSKYIMKMPKYKVDTTYQHRWIFPAFDEIEAETKCVDKIVKKSLKNGTLEEMIPKIAKDFPNFTKEINKSEVEKELKKIEATIKKLRNK